MPPRSSRYAGISRGQTCQRGALNDAYQRIVASGLFETVELVPQGNTLVIRVSGIPDDQRHQLRGQQAAQGRGADRADQVAVAPGLFAGAGRGRRRRDHRGLPRARAAWRPRSNPKIIRRSDNRVDLVFEITEGTVVEIERLSFVGNRAFSDRRLRQVLETKQAGLAAQLIQRDTFMRRTAGARQAAADAISTCRAAISTSQVLDATAESARERDAIFVTFTMQRRPQLHASARSPPCQRDRRRRCRRIRGRAAHPPGRDLFAVAHRQQHHPDGERWRCARG